MTKTISIHNSPQKEWLSQILAGIHSALSLTQPFKVRKRKIIIEYLPGQGLWVAGY